MKKRYGMLAVLLAGVMVTGSLGKVTYAEEAQMVAAEEGMDVRYFPDLDDNKIISETELSRELIRTLMFNENTDFKSFEETAGKIMEEGKNPGLGVKKLHEKGITGKNVNVAIIDQPALLNHPEYKGRVVAYKNFCGKDGEESSMHGPAVISLFAGKDIGVAPGVNIYYAAMPSWKQDSVYFAKAIRWILKQNEKLPEDEKIRVISISAAPFGEGSPFTKHQKAAKKAYKQAKKAGMVILDANSVIGPCYRLGEDIEDAESYKAGFGKGHEIEPAENIILAPTGGRTTAETFKKGEYSYAYFGLGGLSWGIPYAAGTLALGWQVVPEKSGEEMLGLLYDTTTVTKEGGHVINPVAFIEAVQQ